MNLHDIAKKYIGIKEKPNNGGFNDSEFESRIKKDGEWQKGWAWCACFVQLCVAEWKGEKFAEIDALFMPSVMQTYNNLRNKGYAILKTPTPGALVFWQHYKKGKPTPQGHIGIVDMEGGISTFTAIEGNTNSKGSREGDCVAIKTRELNFEIPKYGDGLRLLGFIRV